MDDKDSQQLNQLKNEEEFELICSHKDNDPKNLNEVFSSYGCHTLESNAPIVDRDVVEKIMNISPEQQQYATLTFQSKAGKSAVQNRPSRTRNRDLSLVNINGSTMISAGEVRDRSPVDADLLDIELELYRAETARRKSLMENKSFFPDTKKDLQLVKMEIEQTITSMPATMRASTQFLKPVSTTSENVGSIWSQRRERVLRMAREQAKARLENNRPMSPISSQQSENGSTSKTLDDDLEHYMEQGKVLKQRSQAILTMNQGDIREQFERNFE